MVGKDYATLVRRFLDEAYNQSNLDVGDELLTPDCVFHTPGIDIEGIEGWKKFASTFLMAFPGDLKCMVEETVTEGDSVAARWTCNGTHRGMLRGIPPTDRQVTWIGMGFYLLSDGKIKEVWGLNDQLSILQQVGAISTR